MVNKKLHFEEIDICKGIAILLVVIYHAFIRYPINLVEVPWCNYIMDVIRSFFMPLFFVLSGFLFAKTSDKRYAHVMSSKFKRLLVPMLSYEFVTLFIKMAFPSVINRKVIGTGDYLMKIITMGGGEMWFVYVLFLIFVIWGYFLPRMRKWMIIIAIVVFQVLHFTIGGFENNFFLNDRIFYFSTFFLLGYISHDFIRTILSKNCFLYVYAFLFIIVNIVMIQHLPVVIKWLSVAQIVGVLFCWSLSFSLVGKKYSGFLTYCGKYSLQFYIFNGFALVPARVFMCNVFHVTHPVVLWVCISIMSIVGIIVVTELCKRIKYVNIAFGIK